MEKIIIDALERFKKVLEFNGCECDEYAGYTCTMHSDMILVESALKICKGLIGVKK